MPAKPKRKATNGLNESAATTITTAAATTNPADNKSTHVAGNTGTASATDTAAAASATSTNSKRRKKNPDATGTAVATATAAPTLTSPTFAGLTPIVRGADFQSPPTGAATDSKAKNSATAAVEAYTLPEATAAVSASADDAADFDAVDATATSGLAVATAAPSPAFGADLTATFDAKAIAAAANFLALLQSPPPIPAPIPAPIPGLFSPPDQSVAAGNAQIAAFIAANTAVAFSQPLATPQMVNTAGMLSTTLAASTASPMASPLRLPATTIAGEDGNPATPNNDEVNSSFYGAVSPTLAATATQTDDPEAPLFAGARTLSQEELLLQVSGAGALVTTTYNRFWQLPAATGSAAAAAPVATATTVPGHGVAHYANGGSGAAAGHSLYPCPNGSFN